MVPLVDLPSQVLLLLLLLVVLGQLELPSGLGEQYIVDHFPGGGEEEWDIKR